MTSPHEGILLIDKPMGKTSFFLVRVLRRLTKVQKIGHTGTLDPMATGLMVLLVGKKYTRMAMGLTKCDKEYTATIHLGVTTTTLDTEGQTLSTSSLIPLDHEVQKALDAFQGEIEQTPPMFSALKKNGKKLYELARQGLEVAREARKITLSTTLISYSYPYIKIHVRCTSGTYIRQLASDIGDLLNTGAHLCELRRTRVGQYSIDDSHTLDQLENLIETLPYQEL